MNLEAASKWDRTLNIFISFFQHLNIYKRKKPKITKPKNGIRIPRRILISKCNQFRDLIFEWFRLSLLALHETAEDLSKKRKRTKT